jgi:Uncharacterized protein involved in cytokinesis, contains TGc (transglutaminase/protease-like) domain
MKNLEDVRMKKKSPKILIIVLMLFAIFIISGDSAYASGTVDVDSIENFYDELSNQIYARDAYRYYSTKNESVAGKIKHFEMIDYELHYREDKPFLSGCYLAYYLNSIHMSISSRGTKALISFPYTKEEMDAHFKKLDQLAVELKGKTDYETVLNVHNYLIKNFEYDYRTEMVNHTDIDGFRDGEMVCSGYSLAAYYLLNSAGVKTRTVMGSAGDDTSGEITHMWNVVKLEDKWYNLDITWDDRGGDSISYEYFLKSDEDFKDHTRSPKYNSSNFGIIIADKSYKSPSSISGGTAVLILLAAAVATFLIIFLKRDNKL